MTLTMQNTLASELLTRAEIQGAYKAAGERIKKRLESALRQSESEKDRTFVEARSVLDTAKSKHQDEYRLSLVPSTDALRAAVENAAPILQSAKQAAQRTFEKDLADSLKLNNSREQALQALAAAEAAARENLDQAFKGEGWLFSEGLQYAGKVFAATLDRLGLDFDRAAKKKANDALTAANEKAAEESQLAEKPASDAYYRDSAAARSTLTDSDRLADEVYEESKLRASQTRDTADKKSRSEYKSSHEQLLQLWQRYDADPETDREVLVALQVL